MWKSESEVRSPSYKGFQKTTFFVRNNFYKHSQQRSEFIAEQLQRRCSVEVVPVSRSQRRIAVKHKTESHDADFHEKIGGSRTVRFIVEYLLT